MGRGEPLPVVEFGASFGQLIAVTRARDAVRRAARQAAAQQQQQQQREEEEQQEELPQQPPPDQQELEAQSQEEQPRMAPDGWDDDEEEDSEALWADVPLSQSQQAEWLQRQQRLEVHRLQGQNVVPNRTPHRLAQSSAAAACLPGTAGPAAAVLGQPPS